MSAKRRKPKPRDVPWLSLTLAEGMCLGLFTCLPIFDNSNVLESTDIVILIELLFDLCREQRPTGQTVSLELIP